MFNENLVSERDSAKPIRYVTNPDRLTATPDNANYTATMYWEPHPTHGERITAADWKTMIEVRDVLTNFAGKNLVRFNLLLADSHAKQLNTQYVNARRNLLKIDEMASEVFGNKYNPVWMTDWNIDLEMAPTLDPKLEAIYKQEKHIIETYLVDPNDVLVTLLEKDKVNLEELYHPVTILYLRSRRKSGTQFVLNAPWEFA
ncbi:MAG: hypothetical protein WCK31_05250 [bacterium]